MNLLVSLFFFVIILFAVVPILTALAKSKSDLHPLGVSEEEAMNVFETFGGSALRMQ
jgi:hypothetical protein